MKMIALKDFYDQYGGRDIKAGTVFNIVDSKKDEMLEIKVNGEAVCQIYDESLLSKKKSIVIKRMDAVKYISLIALVLYLIMAFINKMAFGFMIFHLIVFFFLYNILVLLNNCLDLLKSINKNLK